MNVASLQSKLDESQAKVENFNTQVTTLQVCDVQITMIYIHVSTLYMHTYACTVYVYPNLTVCLGKDQKCPNLIPRLPKFFDIACNMKSWE